MQTAKHLYTTSQANFSQLVPRLGLSMWPRIEFDLEYTPRRVEMPHHNTQVYRQSVLKCRNIPTTPNDPRRFALEALIWTGYGMRGIIASRSLDT